MSVMRAAAGWLAWLVWLAAAPTQADEICADQTAKPAGDPNQYFMVLAGRNEVFYDRSGPAFVMLIKNGATQSDMGAFGIYADEQRQPRFGAVPVSTYEGFLRESLQPSEVMLRLKIDAAQYARALAVLRSWERRVREDALLYPEIALDNILLVKQATEELNRCELSITPYVLDWGLEDEISEHNSPRRVPFEYFKTLRQLNEDKHVRDADMPAPLLLSKQSLSDLVSGSTSMTSSGANPSDGASSR